MASSSADKKQINLSWNKPTISPKPSKSYFKYRSQTHYYVWQNDSADNIRAIGDSQKWYLRDSTTTLNISLVGNMCGDYGAFRVEARDTVITIKQGYGLNSDKFDTLVFSTFSLLDSVYMRNNIPTINHDPLNSIRSSITSSSYQWYNCNTNTAISGATNRVFIPTAPGNYQVEIGTGSCPSKSTCFAITTLLNDSVTQIDNQTLLGANVNQKFQWIDCRTDTLIPGATNREFIPSDTGYYALVVSAYGYKDTSRCVPMIAIGILENQFEKGLSIFPNPANGVFKLKSDKQRIQSVRVTNIKGQLVQDFESL